MSVDFLPATFIVCVQNLSKHSESISELLSEYKENMDDRALLRDIKKSTCRSVTFRENLNAAIFSDGIVVFTGRTNRKFKIGDSLVKVNGVPYEDIDIMDEGESVVTVIRPCFILRICDKMGIINMTRNRCTFRPHERL